MAKSISDLLKEADSVLAEKSMGVKVASQKPVVDYDAEVQSLHDMMMKEAASVQPKQEIEETPLEKIAHACAIIETVLDVQSEVRQQKVAQAALENGFSQEEVNEYMEKNASDFLPLHKVLGLHNE